jgi:hypothetical protein
MPENIMDSYLVKLGGSLDMPSISKFTSVAKEMGSVIENVYAQMAIKVAEFTAETVTAFIAVGAAAIKMADSIAQSDQDYRLFALHMYMNQNAARGLKIALDALGQPLENIAWDPELRKRYDDLIKVQAEMKTGLGPDFEKNMKSLRDVRFEFTKLEVSAKYLSMGIVSSIFDKMGLGSGALLEKLEQMNSWVTSHAPQIVEFFSSRLAPVLLDIKDIVGDVWEGFKELGAIFTNIIGILTGDRSIEGATFNFNKFAAAVGKVTHMLSMFVEYVMLSAKTLAHLADAVILFASGHPADALAELKTGLEDYGATLKMNWEFGAGLANGVTSSAAADAQANAQFTGQGNWWRRTKQYFSSFSTKNADTAGINDSQSRAQVNDAIDKAAARYSGMGINAAMLRTIANIESSGNPHPRDAWAAGVPHQGLGQLSPSIQRRYGVNNPYDPYQNAMGMAGYLADLLRSHNGNILQAVAAYNGSGPDAARYAMQFAGQYPGMTQQPTSSSIVINGGVHAHVAGSNATPQDIGDAVVQRIQRVSGMQNQRNAAQMSSPYAFSY